MHDLIWPANRGAIEVLAVKHCDALFLFYGLAIDGTVDVKRRALRKLIIA